MLITYRNHPVLSVIRKDTLDAALHNFKYHKNYVDSEALRMDDDTINKYWLKVKNSDIKTVSKPFFGSMMANRKKLFIPTLVSQLQSAKRTIIYNGLAYVYNLSVLNNCLQLNFVCVSSTRIETIVQCKIPNLLIINSKWPHWSDLTYEKRIKDKGSFAGNCAYFIILFELFFKYAPIEIRHLEANKRAKDFQGKYVNQTDFTIEIVDSTWFTTLIKSEGFKVRGHFRLQACGPGLSERRLTWVTEHEKQGYVRNFKRPINIDD